MTNSTDMQALENNLQTDDSFKQKQALLKLLTSEDFAELPAISNSKFNIFQALKLQNNEVKHSNFLGWLLNPFESHYLMDCFFKELLKIALRNDSILVDIILKDLTDAKVTLEKMTNDGRRIDIFIDCPRNKLVCVIENKIWSGEGCNQLEDYRSYILNNDKYKDYKYKIFLFLTPYKYSPCEDYKGYIRINYGDILKAINNLMKQYGCLLEDDVKIFIEHYKRMVERNIMGETDKEIVDLCRKIYRENKEAIDLIVENSDESAEIFELFVELLKERTDVDKNIVVEGKSVKFLPKGINNTEKLAFGEFDNNMIVNLHSLYWGKKPLYIEIAICKSNDKEKRNSLIKHISKCFSFNKFNGNDDWSYSPTVTLIEQEELASSDGNKELIKKYMSKKLDECGYIEKLKDALNSWNPEKKFLIPH